jgi:hypothetical protein
MTSDQQSQQNEIQQNVEAQVLNLDRRNIRSMASGFYLLRGILDNTRGGTNYLNIHGAEGLVNANTYAFCSLTEVDANSLEPKSTGTAKYIVSNISPAIDVIDLKFEAYNGAEGTKTRVDMLFYTG